MPEPNAPFVSVSVGPVEPDDSNAKFSGDPSAPDSEVWTDYEVVNRYEKDNRVYMMPIAAPVTSASSQFQDTVAFVQLANPTLLWIADWTCSRWKTHPKIPNPAVGGNWVLLDEHLEPGSQSLAPDGTSAMFRISGTYFYGNKRPNADLYKDAFYAKPPWMEEIYEPAARNLTKDDYASNILTLG